MVRLYLFAERQTEQTFADNVLKLHLGQFLRFVIKVAIAKSQLSRLF